MDHERARKIKEKKAEWEERTLKPALDRFRMKENPTRFYTPTDIEGFDFLEKVGFPGEYPLTAGPYPVYPYAAGTKGGGVIQAAPGLRRAGRYSGYGIAEDTRDYYKRIAGLGSKAGPNLAMDLPTQCGYDSDNLMSRGEVGKVGVAIDTLRDVEIIFEAFQGEQDLDKIASNFTINAPANIFTDESEIEVTTNRAVALPYDPQRREEAEARQLTKLAEVKRTRDNREVSRLLGELSAAAKQEDANLFPHFIACAKAYVTEQEVCDVLRAVFGEYEAPSIL